jgi:hypothetical protein
MTFRVQVMWSSQSLRIASWKASSVAKTGLVRRGGGGRLGPRTGRAGGREGWLLRSTR